MNRHILGLTLFLIIVKTTFLLYWGFFAPKPFISFVENEYYTQNKASNKTNCFPKLEKPLPASVDVATLNLENSNFSMSLNPAGKSAFDSNDNEQVFLAFYTKDPQPRRIATEFVLPEKISANQIEITRSVDWVLSLKPNQNLYVIPYKFTGERIPSSFDEAKAIPVLLIGRR